MVAVKDKVVVLLKVIGMFMVELDLNQRHVQEN